VARRFPKLRRQEASGSSLQASGQSAGRWKTRSLPPTDQPAACSLQPAAILGCGRSPRHEGNPASGCNMVATMACNGGGSFGGTRARCTPDSRSSRRQPAIWSGFRRRARRAGLSGRVASQTCPPRRTPRCWRPRRARTACTFCSPHAAGAGARAETAAVAHASVTLSRHVRTSIGANGGVRARGILAGSQAGVANQRAAARPPQPAVR